MATETTRITRADLEARLKSFQDDIQGRVQDRRQSLIATAATVGVVLLVIFFLLGRRSGRKKTTIVEIRRV